jgi:hypothetical protein
MKVFFTFLILSLLTPAAVRAQDTADVCKTNRNAPPVSSYSWPPEAAVKVYFTKNAFTPEQQKALLGTMTTWTQASNKVGAGVTFSYAGETDSVISCQRCLTITRREVYKNDHKHYALFSPLSLDNVGLLRSAWIELDVATTSPRALQGFMAHELGHGMGLWDCPTCKGKQTIMNGFPGVNRDNGLISPSNCDLEVVREVYMQQRRIANNRTAQKVTASNLVTQ